MTQRVTDSMLQSLVDFINDTNGKPRTPYTADNKPNPGTFYLEGAYGGNRVVKMTESGIDSRDIDTGFVTKKELYKALRMFANGLTYK